MRTRQQVCPAAWEVPAWDPECLRRWLLLYGLHRSRYGRSEGQATREAWSPGSALDSEAVSVYVDRMEARFGRMIVCHMIADTPGELHAMADQIGVQRKWYQTPPKASFWHYDIAKAARAAAVRAGAFDCDRNTFVGHLRRIRSSQVFGVLSR